jgi:hypothetical protein
VLSHPAVMFRGSPLSNSREAGRLGGQRHAATNRKQANLDCTAFTAAGDPSRAREQAVASTRSIGSGLRRSARCPPGRRGGKDPARLSTRLRRNSASAGLNSASAGRNSASVWLNSLWIERAQPPLAHARGSDRLRRCARSGGCMPAVPGALQGARNSNSSCYNAALKRHPSGRGVRAHR